MSAVTPTKRPLCAVVVTDGIAALYRTRDRTGGGVVGLTTLYFGKYITLGY